MWKIIAREIIRSRYLPAKRPVGGARTFSSRDEEKRRILVLFESDVWQRKNNFKDELWVVFVAKLDYLSSRRPVGSTKTVSNRNEEKKNFFVPRERLLIETRRREYFLVPLESDV